MKENTIIAFIIFILCISITSDGFGVTRYATSVIELKQYGYIDTNPNEALALEDTHSESDFVRLGLTGYIIVEFACPVVNIAGDDIEIIETTWGPYPLETAEIYASKDMITWEDLGQATNKSGASNCNSTTFDLKNLTWAKYIKVIDTTVIQSTGGFDLNAIGALQQCGVSIEVNIDVKPGSYPNAFNINGSGVVPVAILGSAELDVTCIDPASLSFGGLTVRTKKNGSIQYSIEDVNGDYSLSPEGQPDGYLDLVVQFVDDDNFMAEGDGTGCLSGTCYDGIPIHGCDTIKLVNE